MPKNRARAARPVRLRVEEPNLGHSMAGSTAPKGGRCGRRDGGIKGDPFKEQDGCQARLIHSFPREGHQLLKMLGFWPEA